MLQKSRTKQPRLQLFNTKWLLSNPMIKNMENYNSVAIESDSKLRALTDNSDKHWQRGWTPWTEITENIHLLNFSSIRL